MRLLGRNKRSITHAAGAVVERPAVMAIISVMVWGLAAGLIGCGDEAEVDQAGAPEFFVGAEIEGTATELGEDLEEERVEDFDYESGEEEVTSSFGGGYRLSVDDISISFDDVEPGRYRDDEMTIVWRGFSSSGHSSSDCSEVALPWVEIEEYEYGIAVGSFAAMLCDFSSNDVHISGSFVASVEED